MSSLCHHKYSSACSSLPSYQDCTAVKNCNRSLTRLGWRLFCCRRAKLCQALSVSGTVKWRSSHLHARAKHGYTPIFWQNLPIWLFFQRPGQWYACWRTHPRAATEQLNCPPCTFCHLRPLSAAGCVQKCPVSIHSLQLGARAAYFKAGIVVVPLLSQGVREAFPAVLLAWLCCSLVEAHQGANGQWCHNIIMIPD